MGEKLLVKGNKKEVVKDEKTQESGFHDKIHFIS
jgi:hypothetical protein